jgi:hypothetical protein
MLLFTTHTHNHFVLRPNLASCMFICDCLVSLTPSLPSPSPCSSQPDLRPCRPLRKRIFFASSPATAQEAWLCARVQGRAARVLLLTQQQGTCSTTAARDWAGHSAPRSRLSRCWARRVGLRAQPSFTRGRCCVRVWIRLMRWCGNPRVGLCRTCSDCTGGMGATLQMFLRREALFP